MVFVDEDVDAELVAELPLRHVLVIEIGREVRIDMTVGQNVLQRTGDRVPDRMVGLFRELPDVHQQTAAAAPAAGGGPRR